VSRNQSRASSASAAEQPLRILRGYLLTPIARPWNFLATPPLSVLRHQLSVLGRSAAFHFPLYNLPLRSWNPASHQQASPIPALRPRHSTLDAPPGTRTDNQSTRYQPLATRYSRSAAFRFAHGIQHHTSRLSQFSRSTLDASGRRPHKPSIPISIPLQSPCILKHCIPSKSSASAR